MDSNTHSTQPTEPAVAPAGLPDELAELAAAVDNLAAMDRQGLAGSVRAQRVLAWRQLLDRQEGLWLQELAEVDAAGAAGADRGAVAPSTAGWLRNRLRMGASTATEAVRTARALFRGPLPQTAQALTSGQISAAHARVLAQGTRQLPDHLVRDAEPVLVETASRVDPPRLRQTVGYLVEVADPEGADVARERRHERRGLWLVPTLDGMVSVDGLLEPEAGETVMAALEPLARPADADDPRQGGQRTADVLTELARRALEGGRLPKTGGVRPQLLVTVDLNSLTGHPSGVGGDLGWAWPLDPEACRRLACDSTVTRVLVSRQPTGHDPSDDPAADSSRAQVPDLQARLRAAMALLPPVLGGAPSQPLDLGRSTRVVSPAQRHALTVRDTGCVFPDCDRPLAWCDAHHLWHWVDGGPTDLDNLALLCRAHHRTVHEGGWQLTRGPDGRFTASPSPPAGRPHRHRHRPSAA